MSVDLIINELKVKFTDKDLEHLAVSLFVNASDKPRIRELLDEYIEKEESNGSPEKSHALSREKKPRKTRSKREKPNVEKITEEDA